MDPDLHPEADLQTAAAAAGSSVAPHGAATGCVVAPAGVTSPAVLFVDTIH